MIRRIQCPPSVELRTFVIRSATPPRYFVPYGPQDQRESAECSVCKTTLPLAARQDVLMFQTPPLERDVEVTGPLTIKLWISSSAVDTDFTAKLIDVYPPNEDYPEGYAMNLATESCGRTTGTDLRSRR